MIKNVMVRARGGAKGYGEIMVVEGNLIWGGKHKTQCTDHVLQKCVLETYKILFTSVTSINPVSKKEKVRVRIFFISIY